MKIDPCPFCGNTDLFVNLDPVEASAVRCDGCGTDGPQARGEVAAIKAWNTRADTPSVQSAPDTVRRQEAIFELEKALAYAEHIEVREILVSRDSIRAALSALKDKVLIPYIGEVSG